MSPIRLFTEKQVQEHSSARSLWINVAGVVYDVTSFLEDHPGGTEIIVDAAKELAGGNMSNLLRDPDSHEHSESAYLILDGLKIGYIEGSKAAEDAVARLRSDSKSGVSNGDVRSELEGADTDPEGYAATRMSSKDSIIAAADDKFLDLNKPLFPQMFFNKFTKAYYIKQVHIPRHTRESPLFFGGWLEPLSRTPWYVVPIVWIPVAIAIFLDTLRRHHLDPENTIHPGFLLPMGMLIWTLVEYSLHRFLFHLDDLIPDHPLFLCLHFTLHGVHHFVPMDKMRLVMPPALGVLLMSLVWNTVRLILPFYLTEGLFAGGLLGYVVYDCMHYYLHHGVVITDYIREMKTYHLDHHYKNYNLGYGITSKFWDHVFGTLL